MATVRDIVTLAARRGKIIGAGAQLKSKEADDGLTTIQGLYEHLFTSGTFGKLTDVLATEAIEAEPWQRIRIDTGGSVVIPDVIDGFPPYDLAPIEVIDTTASPVTRAMYVYEAGIGDWSRLDGLTLNDTAPLSSRSQFGLADLLAVFWNESFGETALPMNIQRGAQAFSRSLMWKIGSDQPIVASEYF